MHWSQHKKFCRKHSGGKDADRGFSLDHIKSLIRSSVLSKAPPKECSSIVFPRLIYEQIIEQWRRDEETRVVTGQEVRIRSAGIAPLTHGPAPLLASCRPIKLAEAVQRMNVIQQERVVYVRTSGECTRIVGCSLLLEDPDDVAVAITLQFYSYVMPEENHRMVFPPGTYLAVMEPYVRHMRDDKSLPTGLRCDNPQHIVVFDDAEAWRRAKSGDFSGPSTHIRRLLSQGKPGEVSKQLCDEGNALFTKQKYAKAIDYYSEGLSAAVNAEQRTRCQANRATAYAKLEQWVKAIDDARGVLAVDPTHRKMHYRLAEALLMAQRPAEALAAVDALEAAVESANEGSANAALAKQIALLAERWTRHVECTCWMSC